MPAPQQPENEISPDDADGGRIAERVKPELIGLNSSVLSDSAFQLYERSREGPALWSAVNDIPWDRPVVLTGRRLEVAWEMASQAVYTEQAGLLTAAQLLDDTDDIAVRLCLATAVSDEARHAEVFGRYALHVGGEISSRHPAVDIIWDGLQGLSEPVEKFLVHTILEGLASDEFGLMIKAFKEDLLGSVYENVRRDENRHVAMGIYHLRRRAPKLGKKTLENLLEVEQRGLELAGVTDPAFFEGLADISGVQANLIRDWIVGRHQERMDRIFERR